MEQQSFQQFLNFILSPELQEKLFWLKISFLVLSGFFLVIIIFALVRTNWLKYQFLEDLIGFLTYRPLGVGKMVKKWNRITKRLDSDSEDEYRIAIIEAEEMLEEVLKKMGYSGKNLKESLEKLPSGVISNFKEVLQTFEIRNKILHDPNYRLSLEEAKKILSVYERALTDLQVF